MSDKSASKKWSDLFCRTTDREDGTPRFSLKGAKAYLYEYDGYSGGHAELTPGFGLNAMDTSPLTDEFELSDFQRERQP